MTMPLAHPFDAILDNFVAQTREHSEKLIAQGRAERLQKVNAELLAELKTATQHIDHMAAWITKQNAGYSFESLAEDMPGMRAAIAKAEAAR
jgi:hypothetical protein